MAKWFFLIAATIILSACSTTRLINPNKPAELSLISARQDQKAEITLADGRRFVVSRLSVKPDSTRGFDGKQFLAVATTDIRTIQQIQRGKGALQGLGIGLGIGMIIGGIIANATYEELEDPCDELDEFSDVACLTLLPQTFGTLGNGIERIDRIMKGMVLGALGGSSIGALIGDAAGARSNYRFHASDSKH